jgi:CBS domain containing-hemolysin-like protein
MGELTLNGTTIDGTVLAGILVGVIVVALLVGWRGRNWMSRGLRKLAWIVMLIIGVVVIVGLILALM